MNFLKKFVVEPGAKVRLGKIDTSYKGGYDSHEQAAAEIGKQVERIDRLQYLLYADARQSLLIVLQGLDAGGKDGVVRHLFTGMNPQGTIVSCFKEPSKVELAHDFLWRIHQRTPAKGEVAIFNRSHYEDVLVPRKVWSERFELINDFERMLAENGTRILKFWSGRAARALQAAARRSSTALENQRERLFGARALAAICGSL